jgi:RimJ/RimL family protein N-acetyltransferase
MDWGFETIGFDRLISLIDPANAASIAVATHLGETPRGEVDLLGNRVLIYAIDRADWERQARPSPAPPTPGDAP